MKAFSILPKLLHVCFRNSKDLRNDLRRIYYASISKQLGVDTVKIDRLVDISRASIYLRSFKVSSGNTTYTELLYICLLTSRLRPGDNFLEIGTLDGTTILNVSLNVPHNSMCYTIDLPHEEYSPSSGVSEGDLELINSEKRRRKKNLERPNIKQFYADSTEFDFSELKFNAAFIDGAHNYSVVKSDTDNVLKYIHRPGFILWHDYYGYNDVAQVIHEIAQKYKIVQIADTSMCFLNLE